MSEGSIFELRNFLIDVFTYESLNGKLVYHMSLETLRRVIYTLDFLLQEKSKLTKQYCERSDCSGRIGTNRKNEQLQKKHNDLIKWLKEMLDCENDIFSVVRVKDVLEKLEKDDLNEVRYKV